MQWNDVVMASYLFNENSQNTSDNSKQTYTAYEQNQKAYQCYYKFGDANMTKIAGSEMIRCQTMYGSINPTIREK